MDSDRAPAAYDLLSPDERSDLAEGHHYEREASNPPTCICGVPWICPVWIEQVIANQEAHNE